MHNSIAESLPVGQIYHYPTRTVITRPGQNPDNIFIVEQGRARICLYGGPREQTLGYLNPGSLFVTHTPAWVETLEPTQIRSWPLQQLRSLIQADANIAISALREVGKILHTTIAMVEDLAFRSVESRLARYLLTESRQQQSLQITLSSNTEILASLLGTSRQTLSTLINRLIKAQVIRRLERQVLVLENPQYLTELAGQLSAG